MICVSQTVFGQKEKLSGWFVQGQFSYIKLTEIKHSTKSGVNWDHTYLDHSKSFAISINAISGYFLIKRRLSLGVGIGYDGYVNPAFNTLPLYGDLRFYFTDELNIPFVHLSLGGLLDVGTGFHRGGYFELGAGYKFTIGDTFESYVGLALTRGGVSMTSEPLTTSADQFVYRGLAFTYGVYLY